MAERILVVEDDSATRMLVAQTLEHEGYEVRTVGDGRLALGALADFEPALVVLDIMLPGQDGLSILGSIRGSEKTRGTPVVMLTARADPDATWAGWQAGCDYYLPKPFDLDHLCSVVSRLLSSSTHTGVAG